MSFIPEGDVYRLIAHSKLPKAQEFESWVFDEVLPTIQKHGAYMTEQTLEDALTSPDFLIRLAPSSRKNRKPDAPSKPRTLHRHSGSRLTLRRSCLQTLLLRRNRPSSSETSQSCSARTGSRWGRSGCLHGSATTDTL